MSDIEHYIDIKLNDVTVSYKLSNQILNSTTYQKKHIKTFVFRRCAAIVLVVIICFIGTATALAATVPAVNDWLYNINKDLAEWLYPVNQSVEDNGIKVDVLYAANDNHTAMVYFSIQDMNGYRVDETIDIYNYSLQGPLAFYCRMISYEEETNTAFFQMTAAGGADMIGKMTTFCIDSFLSKKTVYDWYDTQISLADIVKENPSYVPMANYYCSGGSGSGDRLNVLTPDVMNISLGEDIDFVTISNIGFVDGKLHIQTKWSESVDNHGTLALTNKNSSMTEDKASRLHYESYYFHTEVVTPTGDFRTKHIEYIYDISSIKNLSDYSLWARFTEDGEYTQGKWEVNFRLSNTQNIVVDNVGDLADSAELSPLGFYINGYRNTGEGLSIAVYMQDGKKILLDRGSCYIDENLDATAMSFMFEQQINIEDVKNVVINDNIIYEASS